ncbi:MAG: hypothetical protein V1928_05395 [Parcubacteria group bacterium]
MNLLVSTPQNNFFSVAIGDKVVVDFRIVKKEYSQSELLLKTVEELLRKAGRVRKVSKAGKEEQGRQVKIKNIFVVEGPGAFSALRIGIATANALAYAMNAPVIGVRLEKEWEGLAPEEQLEKIWDKAINAESRLLPPHLRGRNKFVRPFYGMDPHITSKRETTCLR